MAALGFGLFCFYFRLAHKSDIRRLKKTHTQFIAHRGLTSLHLENSKEALLAAFEAGADGVEFDVQLSKDGVPMVFHDHSLKRLCGLNKTIDSVNREELSHLQQSTASNNKEYAIATLDDILANLPEKKLINIELKESKLMKTKTSIEHVLQVIDPHMERLSIVISSFDITILRLVAAARKNYALGLLLDKHHSSLTLLRALSLVPVLSYLHPHLSLLKDFHKKMLDDLGFPLIVWGHKKMGTEKTALHQYALISDSTSDLIARYKNL